MSRKVQYPNGYIGVASDKVAETLAKRPSHKILEGNPEPPKPFKPKADAEPEAKK